MTYHPNREELAWAGGFFEGEGCISQAKKASNIAFRLSLVNTDLEDLERFHRAVGGVGKVYGPYSYKDRPTHKPQWQWVCQRFETAQAVLAMLWPGLSTRRRETARETLAACTPRRKAR